VVISLVIFVIGMWKSGLWQFQTRPAAPAPGPASTAAPRAAD
jgi:hypothetical protein